MMLRTGLTTEAKRWKGGSCQMSNVADAQWSGRATSDATVQGTHRKRWVCLWFMHGRTCQTEVGERRCRSLSFTAIIEAEIEIRAASILGGFNFKCNDRDYYMVQSTLAT